MKVLIVNTYDRGGAANSCKRLHLGLLNAGVDSKVLLKDKQNDWAQSYRFQATGSKSFFQQKLWRNVLRVARKLKIYKPGKENNDKLELLKTRPKALEMFSFPQSDFDITQSPLYKEADIINLHWVADFLDYQSFFRKNNKPVVWTLHDMNPFSGVEHYAEPFLGIDSNGLPKPREISDREIETSMKHLAFKKKSLARFKNLTIVAPSKWLANEARKSELFKDRNILHIPYGLDSVTFYPMDKSESRELLNIPKEKKVILFVSDSLKKNRKGFLFLQEAYSLLEGEDFLLCAIGNIDAEWKCDKDILELGLINDDRLMCTAYSAADVFVIPSLIDNLPNTVLESLMCATPVIGFPIGGIPDMVKNWKNGFITEEISVSSLHHSLLKFFASAEKFNRKEIRENALMQYRLDIQSSKYISLFQDLLHNPNSGSQ